MSTRIRLSPRCSILPTFWPKSTGSFGSITTRRKAPRRRRCRNFTNSVPLIVVDIGSASLAQARAVIPPLLDGGTLSPLVSPDGNLGDGETSLTTSFVHARGWFPGSVFGPGVVGTVATVGAVA